MTEVMLCPFTVLIDSREQRPFSFGGLRADARHGRASLTVPLKGATLQQGDYSLEGFAEQVAVERKSLADIFGTIGQGRERFVRELDRLHAMEFAAVVVEADWSAILNDPPPHTQLSPKIVFRSVISWQQRFCNIHWWFMPCRRLAEVTTFRILERFYRDKTNLKK